MAGYLLSFDNEESMFECMDSGLYSTRVNLKWNLPVAATLGDYVTMRPGDNIYFFAKRKIYGIGEIISISQNQAVIENYPGATSKSHFEYSYIEMNSLTDQSLSEGKAKRWIIAFKPSPYLFSRGIDMDDLLATENKAFRSLRAFWKRSFIKLDDEENFAFKAALLRRNVDVLSGSSANYIECFYQKSTELLLRKLNGKKGLLDVPGLLKEARLKDGSLSSEMLLEVGILYQLSHNDETTIEVFGKWDYLSHQVHASPMKPIDYMDKIDVFGYKWIPGYKPIVEKYLIAELKKDKVTGLDIGQVMKYVDWVRNEYAGGDYSMIEAYLVGHQADIENIQSELSSAERKYTVGARPTISCIWNNLSIVSYLVNEDGYIEFKRLSL